MTAVAVVHHLPLAPTLAHLRSLLRPGGRLVVVGCYRSATAADRAVDLVAVPANLLMALVHARGAAAARVAMSAPTRPAVETLPEVRGTAAVVLPGARVRRRLFWRYTLVWTAPGR